MQNKDSNLSSFFIFCLIFLFVACKPSYQKQLVKNSDIQGSDFFIDANKIIIQNEEARIDSLLDFASIPFIKDTTGIRICINRYNDNNSLVYPKDGDKITLLYNCIVFDNIETVLDDILIDTISFKIGHSKQMRGLNYAIKLLKVGDKAKIIIPSYLGFGMSGYGKAVPPYSTLLLNVKLLNIEK